MRCCPGADGREQINWLPLELRIHIESKPFERDPLLPLKYDADMRRLVSRWRMDPMIFMEVYSAPNVGYDGKDVKEHATKARWTLGVLCNHFSTSVSNPNTIVSSFCASQRRTVAPASVANPRLAAGWALLMKVTGDFSGPGSESVRGPLHPPTTRRLILTR